MQNSTNTSKRGIKHFLDDQQVLDYKSRLHFYLSAADARNILELNKLNNAVAKIKKKVNRQRAKLNLPNLR